MVSEARAMNAPVAQLLQRLDRLMAEVSAIREEVSRLDAVHPLAQVSEWTRKVNAAINDPALDNAQRAEVIESVPPPLRHAVAAECYRTNENVTFGWVAAIAGVSSLEAPDLLRVFGVEPEFTAMTTEEMDEEIAALESMGVLRS